MAKKYYDVCMHCGYFESQSKRNAGISTVRYGTLVKDDSRVWQRTVRDDKNLYLTECGSVRPQWYCSGVQNCRQRGKEWQR